MRDLLDQSLEQGAIGMSSGLFYAVANAASTDEVAEVAKPLGKWGGVYTAHMRDEGDNILQGDGRDLRDRPPRRRARSSSRTTSARAAPTSGA